MIYIRGLDKDISFLEKIRWIRFYILEESFCVINDLILIFDGWE